MQLREAVHALSHGQLPQRAVIVTFDDGYADNLQNAKPLLEQYDVPATVFVTAGYVGGEREFLWDALDNVLLQPRPLPGTLRLSLGGNTYEWEFGDALEYDEQLYQRHRYWHMLDRDDPTPRHRLYRHLFQLLRQLPSDQHQEVIDKLASWADAETTARPTHRVLTQDEVVQLANGRLVEVGAHTMTHPVLSALPTSVQRSEIQQSKTYLEELLGTSVVSFAYPFGSRTDYTAKTVAAVRNAGFLCACSNYADIVWRGSDPFQLPRILVRDWTGDGLDRLLRGWIHD